MDSIVLCLCLLQALYSDSSESWNEKVESEIPGRLSVCVSVLDTAEELGVPSHLAVAVAWHESKFNADAVSKAGAVGPMQILPKYWCPDKKKNCDFLVAGIKALGKFLKKYPDHKDALCHYNSGIKSPQIGRAHV